MVLGPTPVELHVKQVLQCSALQLSANNQCVQDMRSALQHLGFSFISSVPVTGDEASKGYGKQN